MTDKKFDGTGLKNKILFFFDLPFPPFFSSSPPPPKNIGYFSIWAMFLVSIWNYGVTIEMIEKQLLSSADSCVYGLGIASIILVIELSTFLALYDIREDNRTTEEEDPTVQIVGETTDPKILIYTLILSIISILYGLFTAGRAKLTSNNFRIDPKLQLIFLGIFVILWLIAAFLCTLIGPFTVR